MSVQVFLACFVIATSFPLGPDIVKPSLGLKIDSSPSRSPSETNLALDVAPYVSKPKIENRQGFVGLSADRHNEDIFPGGSPNYPQHLDDLLPISTSPRSGKSINSNLDFIRDQNNLNSGVSGDSNGKPPIGIDDLVAGTVLDSKTYQVHPPFPSSCEQPNDDFDFEIPDDYPDLPPDDYPDFLPYPPALYPEYSPDF